MTEIGGKAPPKTIEELYKNHEFYIGLGLAVGNENNFDIKIRWKVGISLFDIVIITTFRCRPVCSLDRVL